MTLSALRPGYNIVSRGDPPTRGVPTNTGTWFVVGTAQKGPSTYPQLVRSMTDYATFFGARSVSSTVFGLYDALETFFREGGNQAYVVRTVGPSSAIAAVTLLDGSSGNSLTVSAKNGGTWGNSLTVQVTQPASGKYQLVIASGGTIVDQSPYLTTQADAVSWSRNSAWVNVVLPGSSPSQLPPAVIGATALSGGVDDVAGVTDNIRQAALALFTADLGPGQVSMPGNTTTGNRTALIAHGRASNRQALLDDTDTASRSSAVTEASGLQGDEYGALFGPWVVVPGIVAGTMRTVPPCAFVAGIIARSDMSNSTNAPAAGNNGMAQFAIDVSQAAWTDSDRDLLNTAGLNVIRNFNGAVQLYGFRTLANPNVDATWLNLANQRLREQITDEAKDIAAQYVFTQIDVRGRDIAAFGGALTGMLSKHWSENSLYGDKPSDAFQVDVGPGVNTTQTIANNELHAVLSLRMAPFAELVQIEIDKVSVSQSLAS